MISNNSSTKLPNEHHGKLLLQSIRGYWWLLVICSMVYGFAGPVYTLLKLDNIIRPSAANYAASVTEETLAMEQISNLVHWLDVSGFIFLYVSAVVLAAIIGCVMFFYLQQKQQVNFYHSQPISRTRLFLNQYLTGLFVNILPLLVMMAVSCLLIVAYHMGSALSLTAMLGHVGQLLLLILASYSIAVLSSQLAGTILTQMALNAVLHVCIPIAAFVLQCMCELFFATYSGSPSFMTAAWKFSPLCAVITYLDGIPYGASTLTMVLTPMEGSMLAVLLVMGAALSVLAWFLYQKRPSEATGKALIYPSSEPILKAYLMFVVAIIAGMIFMQAGSKTFFYFAVVVFAILTHMTCEVIIQHDFKAMFGRKLQCAIILLLVCGIVAGFRFDVFSYDAYMPSLDKVEQIAIEMPGIERIYFDQDDLGSSGSHDAAVKQAIYDLLQPVVQEKCYRSSEFDGSYEPSNADYEHTTSITVAYTLQNGKTVERTYRSVPRSIIEESYEALYQLEAYREMLYRSILQVRPEYLNSMELDDGIMLFDREGSDAITVEQKDGEFVATTNGQLIRTTGLLNYEQMKELLQAYQQDLRGRQFATITGGQCYRFTLQIPRIGSANRSYCYLECPVYQDDVRTMALLEKFELTNLNKIVNYSEALIFRCEPSSESELRQMIGYGEQQNWDEAGTIWNDEAYIAALEGKAELTGRIIGIEQVGDFLQQTGLLNESGMFHQFDDSHFVLLRSAREQGSWSNQLLYVDTLPAQYQ